MFRVFYRRQVPFPCMVKFYFCVPATFEAPERNWKTRILKSEYLQRCILLSRSMSGLFAGWYFGRSIPILCSCIVNVRYSALNFTSLIYKSSLNLVSNDNYQYYLIGYLPVTVCTITTHPFLVTITCYYPDLHIATIYTTEPYCRILIIIQCAS